jgi:hypothetical protein
MDLDHMKSDDIASAFADSIIECMMQNKETLNESELDNLLEYMFDGLIGRIKQKVLNFLKQKH